MKFICANCNDLIRESPSPMAFEGWQVHDACGYETFFDKFVVREREKDKQPVALRVRPIGDKSEGVPVEEFKTESYHAKLFERGVKESGISLPGAADLDAVVAEQEIVEATASVRLDGETHVVDEDAADAQKAVDGHLNPPEAPRKKGKGAK